MRKLMWFTMGFGAACAFCTYAWMTEGLIPVAAVFAAAALVLLLCGKRKTKLKAAAIICLGIALGLGWFHIYSSFYLSHVSELDGTEADVTARCTDYSYETDYGAAVEGFLYLDGKPYRGKFYINNNVQMEPGDVLQGRFKLRVTTADSADGPTYHRGEGMFLLAYQREDAQLLKLTEKPFWAYPAMLRHDLSSRIESAFPEDTAPFAKALLLGDRSGIDYETSTAFRVCGIMHIIAVSGLHVTVLFTLIELLCLKRRWLVALIGIPILFLFAAVAGFSPSVVRACVMQALMIGATLVGKDYDGPTELSFASLVMLVVNPLASSSVSLQLSAGCVAGIFLFQRRIYGWLYSLLCKEGSTGLVKIKRWFASSIAMTISSVSLATPLSACYFGTVSLVGIPVNLLTLWVISFIFYGIMLVCLLTLWFPGAAAVAASVVAWPIRYVLGLSRIIGSFPLSAVYTRSVYIVAWIAFCYLLLAIFLFGRQKRPRLLLGCVLFGLCLSLGASWLEPFTDDCRMTVLNVGQGQSIILQSEGKTYLVDCGGDDDADAADLAAETLLSQGISRIDGLILTHFDRDHAGGVAYFLSRIPSDMIFIPDYEDDTGTRMELEARFRDRIYPVSEDIQLSYGNSQISIFAPAVADSGNESSLAVLFRHENCDILITGDRSGFGERLLLKTGLIPQVDVLVAGHHGSAGSACEELLQATQPEIVAISVGENSYGHPARSLLDRLEKYGCIVYRTDIHGNIILRR